MIIGLNTGLNHGLELGIDISRNVDYSLIKKPKFASLLASRSVLTSRILTVTFFGLCMERLTYY